MASLKQQQNLAWLRKKAKKGARAFPLATIAFYGPDDRCASKVAVGIILKPDEEPAYLERWYSDNGDLRSNSATLAEVVSFIRAHGATSVVMPEAIIGCPHEEGIDYLEGEPCPRCPFWKSRDRWTGQRLPGT